MPPRIHNEISIVLANVQGHYLLVFTLRHFDVDGDNFFLIEIS